MRGFKFCVSGSLWWVVWGITTMGWAALPTAEEWWQTFRTSALEDKPKSLDLISRSEVAFRERLTESLIDRLLDTDEAVREDAAWVLAHVGEPARKALPLLMKLLHDPVPAVKLRTVSTLGAIGPPARDAVPWLVMFLKQSETVLAQEAFQALARLVPSANSIAGAGTEISQFEKGFFKAHAEMMRTRPPFDPGVNMTMGMAPAPMEDRHEMSAILPTLIWLLEQGHRMGRMEAIEILDTMGREALPATGELIKALNDGNSQIRRRAVGVLGRIGPETVPQLISILNDDRLDMVYGACLVLGEYRQASKEAVNKLVALLSRRDTRIREQAAWALGEIGAVEALPALTRLTQDADGEVRRQAAWALEKIHKSR